VQSGVAKHTPFVSDRVTADDSKKERSGLRSSWAYGTRCNSIRFRRYCYTRLPMSGRRWSTSAEPQGDGHPQSSAEPSAPLPTAGSPPPPLMLTPPFRAVDFAVESTGTRHSSRSVRSYIHRTPTIQVAAQPNVRRTLNSPAGSTRHLCCYLAGGEKSS
jgi:hypothetical protein